ncbi:SDR family oxidoreductase [Microbacterium sp. AK031]|uniref:SDR family NAD(P)-dependent oxidoreductase n=1 Tax=Microbacterium sp. AK031 TaxID=2723076 RepID=UPI002168B45D|nr:SDR family NAD(P)-dependent oxidoreductase [Microbacterium sp. AK031]MCS3843767.1 short-subunit dehydrogenase [Microbacterium sp. AK031]
MRRLTLAGNTTVITGAASGMGAELARGLAASGVRLALLDHNAQALASVAADLPGTTDAGAVTTHVVDLRDDDAVASTAADVIAAHPRINALITCAGSSMLGSLEQLTMEEMRWLVDVNLWGTVSITKALLPALRSQPAAHITHLASVYALAAPAGRIPYSMSKFAVRGFSEALRHELEGSTVTVGAVYPAGVRTGIILHGRYAATIDPAVAARAASAQAAMYHTEPADAAARIIRATERRRIRTMVGREARLIDVLTRVAPGGYWRVMRGTLRQATDTTTPVA